VIASILLILLIGYLLGVVIICCVMITKQRKYKNVAHISWIVGINTLLIAILVGSFLSLFALQTWDTCQVFKHSENNKTTSGLINFYPAELQPMLDSCIYGKTIIK
jgi:glucan phosphoethanolaminetransferase (alkaline phosphatase superfamily)